jgi:hypothetical protein
MLGCFQTERPEGICIVAASVVRSTLGTMYFITEPLIKKLIFSNGQTCLRKERLNNLRLAS